MDSTTILLDPFNGEKAADNRKRRHTMGDKSKKDKDKHQKQKTDKEAHEAQRKQAQQQKNPLTGSSLLAR